MYATRADIMDPVTGGGFAIFRTVLDCEFFFYSI